MIDIGESTNSGFGFGNTTSTTTTMSQSLLSAEMGMGGDNDNDNDNTLHAGSAGAGGSEYNMKEYFITFVMDIYNLFQTLPIPIQAFLLVLMLYLAWKLF